MWSDFALHKYAMVKIIEHKHAKVEFEDWGCRITYPDGAEVCATPHDTHHYHIIAHRCGYGGDILRYCQEHELAHLFVGEWFGNGTSHVLWELAHGRNPDIGIAIQEEATSQLLQRWWRANERPIIGDADWDAIKRDALALMD
jgi:hypothetical protein